MLTKLKDFLEDWSKGIMYKGLMAYGKIYEMSAESGFQRCVHGVETTDEFMELIKDTYSWQRAETALATSRLFYAMAEDFI